MAKVSKDFKFPICRSCAKIFDEADFYKVANGDYLPICKECCEASVVDSLGNLDINQFDALLKDVDKVFKYDLWKAIEKMR